MTRTRRFFAYLSVWTIFAVALASVPDPASAQNRAYRVQLVNPTGTTLGGTEEHQVAYAGHANLTQSGDVLFDSFLFQGSVFDIGFNVDTRGLALLSGDNVTILESLSDPVPGSVGVSTYFYPFFLSRPNNNGDVTFISEFGLDSTVADHGLWAGASSQLELIARSGDPAPGTSGLSFVRLRNDPLYDLANTGTYGGSLNDGGDLVFRAAIGDPATCIPDCGQQLLQEGLWRHSAFGLELFAQSGDPAPGLDGESFTSFPSYVLNGAGDVVLVAETSTLSLNDGLGDGIWAGQSGGLRPVAVRGQAAPGTGGSAFTGFRSGWFSTSPDSSISGTQVPPGPVTISAGDIGFFARSGSGEGIWTEQAGELRLLARAGDPAPGTAGDVYGNMTSSNMHLNEAGQFAFTTDLVNSGAGGSGLWVGDPDALNLVASTDDEAPGFNPATFLGFNALDLNFSGDVAFDGQIYDFEHGDRFGVWVGGTDGISSVLSPGDAIEVAPGDIRTVHEVVLSSHLLSDNGESRAMNDAGQISLLAFVSGMWAPLVIATPIDPAAPNGAPIAEAGPDQTVTAPQYAVLDAAGTTDAEGTPLFLSWSANGAPLGNGPKIYASLAPGVHTVTLTVTDQQGLSGTDTMTLTVEPGNAPPVADAGPDQTVRSNRSVLLDGTGSFDPEGDTLTYSWKQGGTTVASTATAAVGPFAAGTQTFTLTVSDPDGASSSDTVVITTVAAVPVADAGPSQTLGEGAVFSLDGSASFDPDGGTLTYAWSIGGVEIASEATATIGPLPPGLHVASLRVTDPPGASATDTVVLAVTPSGQEPIDIAGAIRVLDDQAAIQNAIDAAVDGDTILVSPGIYDEVLRFQGKAITLISEFGPELTVVEGSVVFDPDEGLDSVLQGFTVRNGGGISIDRASPKIVGNKILDNSKCRGGGVDISFGSPIIQDNTISGNTTTCSGGDGGGISIGGAGSAQILDNLISDNVAFAGYGGGIMVNGAGTPTIRGNRIEGNRVNLTTPAQLGGGIAIFHISDALIVQNVIVGNIAGNGGGVYWLVPDNGRGPYLVNNTIADNSGVQVLATGFDAQAMLINNTISGSDFGIHCFATFDTVPPILLSNNAVGATEQAAYAGICAGALGVDGNISADPLFVDAANGDYRLRDVSLLVDAGDNSAPGLQSTDGGGKPRIVDGDADGIARIDIGAFEFEPGPVANAGPDREVTDLDTVVLDGTGSFHHAGGALTYDWSLNGTAIATGPTPSVGPFPPGAYAVTLTVTDTTGAATADVVILTVLDSQPPVANAGPDTTIQSLATVTLNGMGSSDPEGGALSYRWELGGTEIGTGVAPSVGPFPVGSHTITLTVTDTEGATASDSVILTVLNQAPVADAGLDRTLPVLATITLYGTGSSDPEGGALTYLWTLAGTQTVSGPAPTVGPFSEGVHTITLTVTDTFGVSDTDSVVLTVTNSPPVADAGPVATIQSLETLVLNGRGSSDPEGGALSYQWTLGGTVIGTGAAPSVGPFPVGSHTITLTVTDTEGATASDSVILTVLNEAPPPPPLPPETGLVAHWALDDGTGTVARDSVGQHDGTLFGPAWVAGGIRCDGYNDYVEIPAAPFGFETWTELTVSAWVTNDIGTGSGTDDIVSWWNYPSSQGWVMTHHKNGRYFAEIGGKGNATGGAASTARTHVAMTYSDPERALRLYVNGTLVATKTRVSGTLPSSNAQIRICSQQDNHNFFDGVIDDVKIWSRALTAQEIAALTGQEITVPVADAGPDATIQSLETLILNGNGSSDPEGGALSYQWKLGGAVIGTGAAPSVGPFPVGSHTITLTVTDSGGATASDSVILTVLNQGPVADAGPDATIQSQATVTLNGTGSSDPEGGILSYQWTLGGTVIGTGAAPSVGPFPVGSHTITLTITDTEGATASDNVILTMLNQGPPPPPVPGLVAHWALDDGTGTVAKDSAGQHDGTLFGPAWVAGGIRCDGFNDYVEIPAAPFGFEAWSELTVAAWVTNDIGINSGTDSIVSWWNYPTSRGWVMTHHKNGKYFAEIGGKGNATGGTASTARAHVAMTYSTAEGAIRLHVNGTLVATKTAVSGTLPSSNAQIRICSQQDNNNFFDGVIDDVKIWSRALTAQEIADLTAQEIAALAGG